MRYFLLVLVAVVMVGCVATAQADTTPFAQVSQSISQPVASEPTQAFIDTVDAAQGIVVTGHELIVPEYGCYFTMFAPQVGSNVGETADFQGWMRVNGEDVANSNVFLRLDDETKDVIVSQGILCLAAGDAVSFWMEASKSGVGIEAVDVAPNPLVPAHISSMYKID